MNYYEHHLGDYMRDTAHLSILEDGTYRRLLDSYYIRERPLPTDARECCKLARAISKPERDAVAYVLREFFELGSEGHRQSRADAEIARFQDKQRKAKASAGARWNGTERNANASPNAMRTHTERNANGMHRAPVPSLQTPDTIEENKHAAHAPARVIPEQPALSAELANPKAKALPACPHLDVLALWAEVLPALPRHLPNQWRGKRAAHLRARWRETAAEKGWTEAAQGIAYLRRLFGYVAQSQFLTGRAPQRDPTKRPFVIELEWLVSPPNWAKVIEGKYHQDGT